MSLARALGSLTSVLTLRGNMYHTDRLYIFVPVPIFSIFFSPITHRLGDIPSRSVDHLATRKISGKFLETGTRRYETRGKNERFNQLLNGIDKDRGFV